MRARAFAEHGCEKMLYDIRMGPQALYHDGTIYVVWQGGTDGPEGHPHVRTYDVEKGTWSDTHRIGTVDRYDHHYCPILWVDRDDRLHVLYGCHHTPGVHLVSDGPGRIDGWSTALEVDRSISYPRVVTLADGRLVMYSRTLGHMGYWVYRVSDDGQKWSPAKTVVDYDRDPALNTDTWAATYHSVAPDADGTGLHVTFIRFNEREGVRKTPNPLYGRHVARAQRYDCYYLHLDVGTGVVTNIDGRKMDVPVNRAGGEACKVFDSGQRLTNQPAVVDDGTGRPLMLLPLMGEESPWAGDLHAIRRDGREWAWTRLTDINTTWDGSWLTREAGGLTALVTTGDADGSKLDYGGGSRIERWRSEDDGVTWKRSGTLTEEPGALFNNPRPVARSDGGDLAGYVTLFGWPGPGSVASATGINDGRAYLLRDGECV